MRPARPPFGEATEDQPDAGGPGQLAHRPQDRPGGVARSLPGAGRSSASAQAVVLVPAEIGEVLGQPDDQRARHRRLPDQLSATVEVGLDVLRRGHLHGGDDQVGHGARAYHARPKTFANPCA